MCMCVMSVPGLAEHTGQQISTQAAVFSAILSLFLCRCLYYCHSTCSLHLSVVSHFSWRSAEVWQEGWSYFLFADVQWSFSLFVTVDLDVGEWQRFLCPFPAMKSSTMSSFNWDIFGWLCPNVPCIVQFTWLCFLPQKLRKSIPLLLACQEAILYINLPFRRQTTWQRWLILATDNTSCL